jgi:hypothetical protein
MTFPPNIRKYIRHHAPFILSLFIHSFIIALFVHMTFYSPNPKDVEANSAAIVFDEGGKSDRLKYQDKSLVDKIKVKDPVVYPNPEINHFPILPQIKFSPDPISRDTLDIIRASAMARSFANPLPNRQPLYTGAEQLAGEFAKHIQMMRRKGLDIVFVFDSTSSMGDFINYVNAEISILVSTIKSLVPAARIGMVTYRDFGAKFVTRTLRLTYGTRALHGFLEDLSPEGGDDYEEAVDEGLRVAIDELNWKKESVKVILLIGDAPPHKGDINKCSRLIKKFRITMGGTVETLDTNRPVLMTNRYTNCPPGADIPCDYILHENLMEEFVLFAEIGGGECIRFIDKEKMNRMMVMNIFGSEWEEYLEVF